MVYATIMAGGQGSRFWPVSTPERPKQLLRLFDEHSMLRHTVDRITPLIDTQNIRIVTVSDLFDSIAKEVANLESSAFILEPLAKNTGPCIGLAAVELFRQDPDAIMVVLPADHRIMDSDSFRETLKQAIDFVLETDSLVTIGVEPTRPETGYGYIQYEPEPMREGVHRVRTFAEKPNRDTALRFIESGEFLWNSGIFVWSAQRILSEIEDYLPELYAALMEINSALDDPDPDERIKRAYQSIKPISIDYGVMERTHNAYVVPGDFGWSDVGSWDEVYRITEKDDNRNVTTGAVVALDSHGSYIANETKLPVAVIGMQDVVVVQTAEGTLICPRDRVQEVKEASQAVQRDKALGSRS
ncbi:mannose-1-phosphate guanylyltransferase [bacterium]|nr:mannose-1-phosphate guanylyltransferase [bacterium]